MLNVKDLVKDRLVRFKYFRGRELWYEVLGTNFTFPVPIDDVGTAVMPFEDKAILYMRWIRPQVEMINEAVLRANYAPDSPHFTNTDNPIDFPEDLGPSGLNERLPKMSE